MNIDKKKNKITGITVNGQEHPFDQVITTVPLPYIPGIAPGLPQKVIEFTNINPLPKTSLLPPPLVKCTF